MKPFLKVAVLLGLMVLVLIAIPAFAGHFCGGIFGGMAALALLVIGGVLFLGLAIVGGGAAFILGLGLLLALASAIIAALLPIALPVLLVTGLVALIVKLTRRGARPAAVA